jgi:hypothetical protein
MGDPHESRRSVGTGSGETGLDRARFLRLASGVGLGVTVGGALGYRLLDGDRSSAAISAVEPDVHRFHSRPDLVPPTLAVVHSAGGVAAGSLFLAPSSGPGQRGTLIADNAGQPVWFNPTTPATAMNLRAATVGGKPVLTWWEGKTENGLGVGTHVVADDSYRVVAHIPAARGLSSDLHEFVFTPSGTLLMTAWEIAERDLTSLGGAANGKVVGGVVQEVDYPSGKLLFEWHSLDHVALDESHAGVGEPFDYFHVNSIAPTDDGNLLVSARNTWAVYKIDRGSGKVIWRLGGKRSDFTMGANTFFAWQHDARPDGDGALSLFDDGSSPKVQSQSRGLVLDLDTARMHATLRRAYPHTPAVLARALGSTQLLPNGNTLVGYGTAPYLTEFGPRGEVLLDLELPTQGENYRALRFPWVGRPLDRPTLALSSITGTAQLYVSWNGATEVDAWLLRAGSSESGLSDAGRARRTGFETVFHRPAGARYAAAVALDARGRVLATSATIAL